jgi:CMP-N,N'-diacetyllegionaminic acid synthase
MPVRPEILALIPARGGSKGIPRKNLLPLAGKPLIAYSIEQALASRFITRTIVSTDDPEIARVAKAHGADVPFARPADLAQDASSDLEVFRHALTTLRDAEGYRCECVVHLRPTGPVRSVERIDEAIATFLDHPEADSLRSVTWPAQTPYKMWRRDGEYLKPCLEVAGVAEAHSQPRQSLPEIYWQNGYIDIVRPRVVLDLNQIAGSRIVPFVMHEPVFELDYPEDIPRVEAELRRLARERDDRQPAVMRHPT